MSGGLIAEARAVLTVDDFFRQAHQRVYAAACAADDAKLKVDLISVSAELRRLDLLNEVGGGEYLLALMQLVPTADHWQEYARIVKDRSTQRKVIAFAASTDFRARTAPDVQTLVADIIDGAIGLAGEAQTSTADHIADHFEEDLLALTDAIRTPQGVTPARWGIRSLDKLTGGLGNQYLVLLMANPGVGKTRLLNHAVLSSMDAFSKLEEPPAVLVFPLEEGRRSWIRNAVAWKAGLDSQLLLAGRCPENMRENVLERASDAHAKLCNFPFVVGEGVTSGRDLVARIRVEARKRKLGLVAVDYLQRLTDTDEERQSLSAVARDLQTVAEHLGVPIVLLSQHSVSATTGESNPYGSRGPSFDASMTMMIDRDHGEDDEYLPSGTLTVLKLRGLPMFGPVKYHVDYEHGARYYDALDWRDLNGSERSERYGQRLGVSRDDDPFAETDDARNY